MAKYDYAIIVIGAGAGGLVVAIGAARAGKKVLLVEKGTWGGDCTNYGCIPSKSLIASAHSAHAIRTADTMGLKLRDSHFSPHTAFNRVREIVTGIRHHEEPEALKATGMDVLEGTASFENNHTLRIINGDQTRVVTGDQIVIATGSHPTIPPFVGLKETGYLTNETIFDLVALPKRLAVFGGGPIGSELAQALCRLGSKVTIILRSEIFLRKEDPDARHLLCEAFAKEGIDILFERDVLEVSKTPEGKRLHLKCRPTGEESDLIVDDILVATGRKPSIDALKLDNAGISTTPHGITVDPYGRTSQKNVWAVGDVTGPPLFTHVAENRGRAVLTSLLMPGPIKKAIDNQPVPRVTYTDPEVASCGLSEQEAIEKYGKKKIATYLHPLEKVDRAITAGATEGFVKVITKKWSSKILGVTIVAPRAGEMLPELTLAMQHGIPLRKLASLIHPYPTYSGAIRQTADLWLTQTLLKALKRK